MLFVSYSNFIAIVPPDITSFVGWNERNKVGIRDGGGAKKENDLPKFTSNVVMGYFTLSVHFFKNGFFPILANF